MKTPRESLRNRKGIQTILAALLMVVIVVVAAVMVYAWATGLLGTLLVNPSNVKETLTNPTYGFTCPSTPCMNVTLYISNSGSTSATLASYYVSDSSGNTWQLLSGWTSAPTIAPNQVVPTNFLVGSSCASCQYTGTAGAFTGFIGGYSYNVKVVTVKGTPFTFPITR